MNERNEAMRWWAQRVDEYGSVAGWVLANAQKVPG